MKRSLKPIALAGVIFLFSSVCLGNEKVATKMHPPIQIRDGAGNDMFVSGKPPSPETTCGQCHDVKTIRTQCDHTKAKVDVGCFDCHVADMSTWTIDARGADGKLDPQKAGIKAADVTSCKKCHGIIVEPLAPVSIPDDYTAPSPVKGTDDPYDITRNTGTIYSGDRLSTSHMNLTGKSALTYSFDVHAKRLVGCTECHSARNNPTHGLSTKKTSLTHLKRDPRQLSLSEYLYRPDHRLITPECISCHEPAAAHDFLPQRNRHMEMLKCQSCHVPVVYGPVASTIDETILDPKGGPIEEYRSSKEYWGHLNGRKTFGFVPFLLQHLDETGVSKIGPFNIVARWYWVDGQTGKKVDRETLRKALSASGGRGHNPGLTKLLDTNGNAKLERSELFLATEKEVGFVAALLKSQAVQKPEIRGTVEAYVIGHGVKEGVGARRSCETCHGDNSPLVDRVDVAPRIPGSVMPKMGTRLKSMTKGTLLQTEDGALRWVQKAGMDNYYVFGKSRARWSELAGFLLFVMTLLSLLVHGGYRVYTRKNHGDESVARKKVYMYSAYERIWHWLMASSVLALLLTGFEIHYPDGFSLFGFGTAVTIHNFAAVVLVVNGFLSLFHHLSSAAIKQFIPARAGLIHALLAQVQYYTQGIFMGRGHPTHKTPERKLNPLQQITYLGLLNVLFPFQVITGVAIWGVSRWPQVFDPIGGLQIIAPLHNLGSWLFLTFMVVHIYLTTTGHTPTSNIKAMIHGYDEIEIEPNESNGDAHV